MPLASRDLFSSRCWICEEFMPPLSLFRDRKFRSSGMKKAQKGADGDSFGGCRHNENILVVLLYCTVLYMM
jgi:hypothetical protein